MKKRAGSMMLVIALILCSVAVQRGTVASAASSNIYQVNGKYSLTDKKLVTNCTLYSADSKKDRVLKKKKRVYRITSDTTFFMVNESNRLKTLTGSKQKNAIKRANKKNVTIQFKERNGKVIFIAFL